MGEGHRTTQGELDKWMTTLEECIEAVEEIHRAVALGALTLAVPTQAHSSSGRGRQHRGRRCAWLRVRLRLRQRLLTLNVNAY